MARRRRVNTWAVGLVVLTAAFWAVGSAARAGQGPGPQVVVHTQNTNALPPYEVFEITFQHDGRYANPFFDVAIGVTLTSPTGRHSRVGGFHYGSLQPPKVNVTERRPDGSPRRVAYVFDRADTWKARFAPAEIGTWTYSYVFRDTAGLSATGAGSFECVRGRVRNHGFVRQHPTNPFRWVFDDGTPYFPIGLQEGWGDGGGIGTALAGKGMEGPFRTDRTDLVPLPVGPLYVRGPSMNPQNADVYARRYSHAGFNLYRFSNETTRTTSTATWTTTWCRKRS